MTRRPHLTVVALPVGGTEPLFDEGVTARRGIHLRWSFQRELGFPSGGFSVYRSRQPGSWGDPIATLNLPIDQMEAFGRVAADVSDVSAARGRYQDSAAELIAFLVPLLDRSDATPMHLRPVPSPAVARQGLVAHLSALDAVLIAAVDPIFARMLGLYWIDEDVVHGDTYYYKVVGHWIGPEWPPREVNLTSASPDQVADGELEIDGVQVFAGARRLSAVSAAEDDLNGPYLRVQSDDPSIPLVVRFPAAIAEAILHIQISGTDPRWEAEADGRPTTRAFDGSRLSIRARDGGIFSRIDLTGADPSWRLYRAASRERLGRLGDLESAPVGLRAAAPAAVAVPTISNLTAAPHPATLGSNGLVAGERSSVDVSCVASGSPVDPYRPVRLHVGRSPATHTGDPTEVLTRAGGPRAPVIVKLPQAEPLLPELVARWDLNGDTVDRRSGRDGILRGSGGFVRRHPSSHGRRALSLRAAGFLEAAEVPQLEFLGSRFAVDAWFLPDDPASDATILGNRRDRSLWLGVRPGSPGHRIELTLNGRPFVSTGTVTDGRWTRITATYDSGQLVLYINGERDSEHLAALGPLVANPGRLCIGADSGSAEEAPTAPFRGAIAQVRIWKAPLHPDECDDRLAHARDALGGAARRADLIASWPGLLEFSAEGPLVQASNRPELSGIGRELTVQAWVNPRPGQAFPTIVGNNWQQSFWLGLLKVDDRSYRLRLWLNRPDSPSPLVPFHSSRAFPADRWTHVTAIYDGREVRLYVDSEFDSAHPAVLGPVRDNPDEKIVVGAGSGSHAAAREFPFEGSLADVRVWRRAFAPADADARLTESVFVDRVSDGDYAYRVQGIDLFGRVSDWSVPRTVSAVGTSPPSPPVNVHAGYLPLSGSVLRAGMPAVTTDIVVPAGFDPTALAGHDAVLTRAAVTGSRRFEQQTFEIESASIDGGRLTMSLRTPPFPQLLPEDGDAMSIPFDWRRQVAWRFTGRQRLFAPRASQFRIYQRPGPLNTLRGTVADVRPGALRGRYSVRTDLSPVGVADVLTGLACQIGNHRFDIITHTAGPSATLELAYDAFPPIAPAAGDIVQISVPADAPGYTDFAAPDVWGPSEGVLPLRPARVIETEALLLVEAVSDAERAQLRDRGVSLTPGQPLYRTVMPRAGTTGTFDEVSVADFVPGVLVARTTGADANPWHALTVLWHALTAGGDLTLYLVSDTADPPAARLLHGRYHPGERYGIVLESGGGPTFSSGTATVQHAIGVSTVDEGGNESGISGPATIVAVDRRRPPVPRPPIVDSIDRADYHGQSRVAVRWTAPASAQPLRYLLYRATDSGVFERDLEQRRLRTGHYRGLDPDAVLADDASDFGDWLSARYPAVAADGSWRTFLFPARANESAWNAATPIWRAWAERFYPALTNVEVRNLAERNGNETAFTLVHDRPLDSSAFVDAVNGLVRNRYLYRLRTQSPALLLSTEWGPVSDPAAAPPSKPPRAPVFTRVTPGDRAVTLEWTLNSEPDVSEYRIYRADSPEQLDDLRWWGTEADPRAVAVVPDPLLRVASDPASHPADPRLVLPSGMPLASAVGVFRRDEFDPAAISPDAQRAFNYLRTSGGVLIPDAAGLVVSGLRRIAQGTPVVLVYRDAAGNVQIADGVGAAPPYVDSNLRGRSDYFYRLVASRSGGQLSEPSEIGRARTLELARPQLPGFSLSIRPDPAGAVDLDLITAAAREDLEFLVERRPVTETGWTVIVPWRPVMSPLQIDRFEPGAEPVTYRVSVRSFARSVALQSAFLDFSWEGAPP